MKLIIVATLTVLLSTSNSIHLAAQKSSKKFGDVSLENLKKKSSNIDSLAGAEIILDYGYTTFDHNFEIIFYYHGRIKIFNETEFDRADIEIPHGARDRVEKLKAATYNLENGEIVTSEVSRKDIFDEEINDYQKKKRFSLPNVKKGSIIEYTYRVNYGGWNSLNPWYFQSSIPSLHSEYIVALPEYFTYKKIMTGYLALTNAETTKKSGNYQGSNFTMNVQRYLMKNVPAFQEEPYMTSRTDYISKIKFELSRIDIPGSINKQVMPPSYAALSRKLAESESFGEKLKKARFMKNEIPQIVGEATDPKEKIIKIYEHFRDNFSVDYDVLSENLKKINDLKKGFPQDINMLMIATLNEAGFDAHAVRLSTKSHGKLHPSYAMKSSFNKTVCHVKNGEEEYLLDASNKSLPFNTLNKNCLNGKGMLVTDGNFKWVDLNPTKKSKKMSTGNFVIDDEGYLSGKLNVSRSGYNGIEFRSQHAKDIVDYKKQYAENKTSWYIDNHKVEGLTHSDKAVKEVLEFESDGFVESTGDLIIFSPLVIGRISENPFKSSERHYPVNYGAPIEELESFRIMVPSGFKPEELPSKLAIGLPDNGGSFIFNVQYMNGVILVSSRLVINKTEFPVEYYLSLREFYAQIVEKHAEQIVLKREIG